MHEGTVCREIVDIVTEAAADNDISVVYEIVVYSSSVRASVSIFHKLRFFFFLFCFPLLGFRKF